MSNNKLFSQFYSLDKLTNCYMIEIALDQYTDIFNEWDPAPFKRREIDPDLTLYLEGCSEEIPLRYPIELCFMIPSHLRNEVMEQECRGGLKNCFSFRIYFLKKDLKQVNLRILNYTMAGFLFLWIGRNLPGYDSDIVWLTVLIEGIFIGGWVFIWEAVSLFFFTNLELYHRYQIYKRLWGAEIIFRG